jgi:D-2-hydroxyacid dehydrogenase (NADP+)
MAEQDFHPDEDSLRLLLSFHLPKEYLKKIQAISPKIIVNQSNDEEELLKLIADADILVAGRFSRQMFLAAKRLKWIQVNYAGVESFLYPEVVSSSVILTNAGGVNAIPVAEHAIGLMFCLSRKLHLFIRNQVERKWKIGDIELLPQMNELAGKTLGIVGLGKIGSEIAKRAKCIGMMVIASRRSLSAAVPEYVDKLVSTENLEELLTESDFVILQLPLTADTDGMIGEKELRSMKPTAFLINTGRGKVIQEDKLIQALSEGWIAGAALDTFAREPLPKNSPLWEMPNVIVTPHVAGLTPYYLNRLFELFRENLKRFMDKEELINVVDKTRGY